MSDMKHFASNCFIILFMVISKSSLSRAQTFQNPHINTPTEMEEGNQYGITCTCVAEGANVALTWNRTNPFSTFPGNETCTPTGIYNNYCTSTYTFTAKRYDSGATVSCIAKQPGNPDPKSYLVMLDITVLPNNATALPDTTLDSSSPETIETSGDNSSLPKPNGTKGENSPVTATNAMIPAVAGGVGGFIIL